MRVLFPFVCIALLGLLGSGCEHEPDLSGSCGVEDPMTELPWLEEYTTGRSISLLPCGAAVWLDEVAGQPVFIIEDCVGANIVDAVRVFDCEGNPICDPNVDPCPNLKSVGPWATLIWRI